MLKRLNHNRWVYLHMLWTGSNVMINVIMKNVIKKTSVVEKVL